MMTAMSVCLAETCSKWGVQHKNVNKDVTCSLNGQKVTATR